MQNDPAVTQAHLEDEVRYWRDVAEQAYTEARFWREKHDALISSWAANVPLLSTPPTVYCCADCPTLKKLKNTQNAE